MTTLFLRRRKNGPRVHPPEGAAFVEGLVTYWYVARRCEEECYRAGRYRRPLALLVVELLREPDSSRVEARLQSWLRSQIRIADVAGYLRDGCYVILLPETDRDGASGLEARLRWNFPGVKTGIGVQPEDGRNLEDLVSAARRSFEEET